MERENSDFFKDQQKKKEETTLLGEINTIKFPITTLDKKRRHSVKVVWKSPDGSRQLEWILTGPRLPGPGALKIQRCIDAKIRELVKEGKLDLQHRRFEYSFYEIAKVLDIPHCAKEFHRIKEHIHDLIYLRIAATSTIYDFQNKKYYESLEPIGIYDRGAFVGDIIDGVELKTSFIEVSEWYLKNIIYGFTKPLLPFYRDLSPTSARLYEILSLHASDEKNILDKRTESDDSGPVTIRHIRIDYSWLCERMPIAKQRDRYHAMRSLENAHEELKRVKYLWEVELDEDWQLHYWLGQEADREIKKRQNYLKDRDKRKADEKRISVTEQQEVVKQSVIEQPQVSESVTDEKISRVLKYRGEGSDVKLAGSFNSWQAENMARFADEWSILLELHPGEYHYKFIVDGVWICDPENPTRVKDSQGNENSVLVVQ